MMALEETGRTSDDAIAAGLRKLGLPREYVLVERRLRPGTTAHDQARRAHTAR